MRYLKLYEEAGSDKVPIGTDFEAMDYRNWSEFIKKIVSIDSVKANMVSPELKKEIRKTIQIGSSRRRKITDETNIPSSDLIDYLIVYQGNDPIFIYEIEDEYYAVCAEIGKLSFRFKCDQIEGVSKCINHIMATPQPEPKPTKKRR